MPSRMRQLILQHTGHAQILKMHTPVTGTSTSVTVGLDSQSKNASPLMTHGMHSKKPAGKLSSNGKSRTLHGGLKMMSGNQLKKLNVAGTMAYGILQWMNSTILGVSIHPTITTITTITMTTTIHMTSMAMKITNSISKLTTAQICGTLRNADGRLLSALFGLEMTWITAKTLSSHTNNLRLKPMRLTMLLKNNGFKIMLHGSLNLMKIGSQLNLGNATTMVA